MNGLKYKAGIGMMLIISIMMFSCQQNESAETFTIKNNLNIDRIAETITIRADKIPVWITEYGIDNIVIREGEKVLATQALDFQGDGVTDEILFQVDIKANEKKKFTIALKDKDNFSGSPPSPIKAYSRFVPERIDDYAWENDRVAFRTYGPKAQQITESGRPGGTLTSGIDCWLKRVNYSIIDKWYKKNTETAGYYHIDYGEGYDPYHVGGSRGCGGIGVWANDSLYVSRNFIWYRTIASGPIRTIFELTYAPWNANGVTVSEEKTISLDLGSNLCRYEVNLMSDHTLPAITIGVTLHDSKGQVKSDSIHGLFRYWEPIDDAELGTAIVIDPAIILSSHEHKTTVKDQSHVFVTAKPVDDKIIYYAGFGWNKSGQFNSAEEWDWYLMDFSKRIASPLEVNFN